VGEVPFCTRLSFGAWLGVGVELCLVKNLVSGRSAGADVDVGAAFVGAFDAVDVVVAVAAVAESCLDPAACN